MTPDPRRGLRAATAISASGLCLCVLLGVWRPPPEHLAGLLLLPAWGLALGCFGRFAQPGWRARALGVGCLVAAGIALGGLWLPGMQAQARDAPLGLRARSDLLSRTLASWHPLIVTRSRYLALGRLVAGREVRWVPSPGLSPRRLLSLSGAARLVEMEEPGPWVPTADEWSERYETLFLQFDERQPGGVVHHRFVGVRDAAERADWFVVLERDGATLAIPGSVWEAERTRAGRAGR